MCGGEENVTPGRGCSGQIEMHLHHIPSPGTVIADIIVVEVLEVYRRHLWPCYHLNKKDESS